MKKITISLCGALLMIAAIFNSALADGWTAPYSTGVTVTSTGTSATFNLADSYGNFVYSFTNATSIGNGTITFGVIGSLNTTAYALVSVTDASGNTTTNDATVNVVNIPATPAENMTIDMNLVNPLVNGVRKVDFTKVTQIGFRLVNSPTGFSSDGHLKGSLTITSLSWGTGAVGSATVVNPGLGQEWAMEPGNYLYNANNGGVLVGNPKTVPNQLLSYPYYALTVNGRGNFVGDISALNVWSPLNPASGYKHYLSMSNQTFTGTTVEYSMINAYEWNQSANMGNAKHLILQNFDGTGNLGVGLFNNSAPLAKLHVNGNLLVGLKQPTAYPNYKLAVEGLLVFQKAVVTAPGYWADFVFRKGYKLPTLAEQESYIQANGHLKDVPSEQEVLTNGYDVSAMDAKLLQKVEELYLHVIEMQKQNEAQKKEIEELKKKVEVLQK